MFTENVILLNTKTWNPSYAENICKTIILTS